MPALRSLLLLAAAAAAAAFRAPVRMTAQDPVTRRGAAAKAAAMLLSGVVAAPALANAYQSVDKPTAEWEAQEARAQAFRKAQREIANKFNAYVDDLQKSTTDDNMIKNLNLMTELIQAQAGLPAGITAKQVSTRRRRHRRRSLAVVAASPVSTQPQAPS